MQLKEYIIINIIQKDSKNQVLFLYGVYTGFDKKLYQVPHVYVDVIKVHPNVKYSDSLYSSFETPYTLAQPVCKEGCDTCVWDYVNNQPTTTKCYECA